jgi:hypothetical protein
MVMGTGHSCGVLWATPSRSLTRELLLLGDRSNACVSVTVAGVNVPKQQIALADLGAWRGDNITSGILGLGLPLLTQAYNKSTDTALNYDPLVVTMQKNGVPPIFALGLSRNESESFLSFGGVPDVKTGPFASTPIVPVSSSDPNAKPLVRDTWFCAVVSGEKELTLLCQFNNRGQRARYTIQPELIEINNTKGQHRWTDTPVPVIVDSGTTLNLLPSCEYCHFKEQRRRLANNIYSLCGCYQ